MYFSHGSRSLNRVLDPGPAECYAGLLTTTLLRPPIQQLKNVIPEIKTNLNVDPTKRYVFMTPTAIARGILSPPIN